MGKDPIQIRPAVESDVPGIRAVFRTTYGEDYPYSGFIDIDWLKHAVFNDNLLMLVAQNTETEQILGTASVVCDIGADSDLLGEFGRLAVLPEARGHRLGTRMMEARIEQVKDRLHVGVVENRTRHFFSQKISTDFDFVPMGFLPLKHQFQERESTAFFVRYFGNALSLRRNNPHVIPEAQEIAYQSLTNCNLPFDVILDEESQSHPPGEEFPIQDLTADDMTALIRIERGRIRGREIFGPMRLQYGMFRLIARHASYLVAKEPSAKGDQSPVAGAIGYIHDEIDRSIRIFELIAPSDRAVRFLFQELLDRAKNEMGVSYVEIDVSAHAPQMQRTLVELGFLPVAYVPAMVFHRVERRDVIKMGMLFVPPEFGELSMVPEANTIAEIVMRNFKRQYVLPEVARALNHLELFDGLSKEQSQRVATVCSVARYAAGETLFESGGQSNKMFVLIEGKVGIVVGATGRKVGEVEAGGCVGEIALLTRMPHSSNATAHEKVTAAVLTRGNFEALVRQRPDIGTVLYRNMAMGLGGKLHGLNREISTDK